jgi:hypothetical protein
MFESDKPNVISLSSFTLNCRLPNRSSPRQADLNQIELGPVGKRGAAAAGVHASPQSRIENVIVNLYTRTGDQQRSRPASADIRPEELFHALAFGPRRSGYRPPEVSPWTDRLDPGGGIAQLKPALRLMTAYRVVIQEVTGAEVLTSYTRWLECVQVKEGPEPEVYVAFSPRFERIWMESKKRLPEYMEQKPANARLRSQYALRLYSWAKQHVDAGANHFTGGAPTRVWPGVDQGSAMKHHSGSAFARLGKLPATGARRRDCGG